MTALTITRTFDFCAGHRLFRPDWSDAENRAIFGACSNPAGHGHNYTLELTVGGEIDGATGMVMNLRQLKELVNERVLADVDHKNLNVDVPWLAGVIPTTENFARALWERLDGVLAQAAPKVRLAGLVLHETPKNKVTITR